MMVGTYIWDPPSVRVSLQYQINAERDFKTMHYLLTIPARNEAATISAVINEYLDEASRLGIMLGVQVVDDNSIDDTFRIVTDMRIPVYRVGTGSGLANVFKKEMERALLSDADVFIHVDGDGQHSARDLHLFIEKLSEGFDLVLGNRMHTRPFGMPDIHYTANILLSEMVSILSGTHISDSQTGYRAMRRSVVQSIQISSTFTYTQEQIIRAKHGGFKIGEVCITPRQRISGSSRLVKNPFYYLKHAFADLERLSFELDIPINSINRDKIMNKRYS
jgi:glycosyltransferase involved in cell wall biosynthesis